MADEEADDPLGDFETLFDDFGTDGGIEIIGAWTQAVGSASQDYDAVAAANFVGQLQWSDDENEGDIRDDDESIEPQSLDEKPVNDYGQRNERWLSFLHDFASAAIYNRRVNHFFWHGEQNKYDFESTPHELLLLQYFEEMHQKKNSEGEPQYRGTVQRSWYSMFKRFWEFVHLKKLESLIPQLNTQLGKWEKLQPPVTQARTFTEEDLSLIYGLELTPDILPLVAYAVR